MSGGWLKNGDKHLWDLPARSFYPCHTWRNEEDGLSCWFLHGWWMCGCTSYIRLDGNASPVSLLAMLSLLSYTPVHWKGKCPTSACVACRFAYVVQNHRIFLEKIATRGIRFCALLPNRVIAFLHTHYPAIQLIHVHSYHLFLTIVEWIVHNYIFYCLILYIQHIDIDFFVDGKCEKTSRL